MPQANGGARCKTDQTVHLPHVIAFGLQALLHRLNIAAPHGANGHPRPIEGGGATHPIREMADEERIKVGLIVPFEDVEVLRNQKGRPQTAGRHQQEGGCVAALVWQGGAANGGEAEAHPLLNCSALPRPFQCARDASRHVHLYAPAPIRAPAVLPQIVRDGREAIGRRAPDVTASVAIPVNGVAQELRR